MGIFPGREAESSEERCLLPAGLSPGTATLYVTCNRLQQACEAAGSGPFPGGDSASKLCRCHS